MISIIIAASSDEMVANVTASIARTIGVAYELIVIDNKGAKKGLCAVYNEGAKQAAFDILCFAHEDILFQTNDWGQNVIRHFNTLPNVGIIGVFGTAYKPVIPNSWGDNRRGNITFGQVVQGFKYDQEKVERIDAYNPLNEKFSQVIAVDGMWFCTLKQVVAAFPFDAQTFTGFHYYDIDFSMAVAQQYYVYVVFDILIQHLSEGRYDETWFENSYKFMQKWQQRLPVSLRSFPVADQMFFEKRGVTFMKEIARKNNVPVRWVFKTILSSGLQKKYGWYFLLRLLKKAITA